MISQDEITTIYIYAHYKVSKNIKIINWYCENTFIFVIIMVKFMQISFRQRFIRKKFIGFGGFNLFLVLQ